jgi:hypothetical protein
MKFLKKKIQKFKTGSGISQGIEVIKTSSDEVKSTSDELSSPELISDKKIAKEGTKIQKRNRVPGCPISKHSARAIKNMAKNFGRAICNFALSDISNPYLIPIANKIGMDVEEFRSVIRKEKDSIEGIDSFRNLMLIKEGDSKIEVNFKKIFQQIGEVFMKYFSVNWIFDGKVTYKQEYLKYRFKILRRIQRPDLFTYIK